MRLSVLVTSQTLNDYVAAISNTQVGDYPCIAIGSLTPISRFGGVYTTGVRSLQQTPHNYALYASLRQHADLICSAIDGKAKALISIPRVVQSS